MATQILPRLRRALVASLATVGLMVAVVTFSPLVRWWGRALAGPWDDPRGEVLIVLAGGIIDDEMLASSSYWRAVYAVRVWREAGVRQVVVAGRTAAPLMRDLLVCHGVPASAILVENGSTSTRENALNVKQLLAGVSGRKVLLTSEYHMFRARRAFGRAGLAVLPRPFPDVGKRASRWIWRWDAFLSLVSESGKIGYYYLRGWI